MEEDGVKLWLASQLDRMCLLELSVIMLWCCGVVELELELEIPHTTDMAGSLVIFKLAVN